MKEEMERMLGFVLKHYRQGAFEGGIQADAQDRRIRSFPIWRYVAAAAAAAAVILLVFLFRPASSTLEYLAVNTPERVELPDGSIVTLRPGASLRYSDSKDGRNVNLEGTALFKVARDENRPFNVNAGESVVKVLGTEFQVKQSKGNVFVDVFEGRVLFSGSEDGVILTSGMESVLQQGAEAPEIVEVSFPNPTAWMTGVFKYDGTSLDTVLAELSDYYGREFVTSPEGQDRVLTGSFFIDEDPETIVDAISSALEINITVK